MNIENYFYVKLLLREIRAIQHITGIESFRNFAIVYPREHLQHLEDVRVRVCVCSHSMSLLLSES